MRLPPLALLVLVCALPARAQDEPLPDLTPREFTIPGELRVSLPDLQRQPLRGFGPPPRTYVVPADRQVFVPPYGQDPDALPADSLAAPPTPALARAEPRIGQLDALAGRYFARRGRLTVGAGGLGLDARYSGFSAYTPPPELNARGVAAPADDFEGVIRFTTGDALRLALQLDGGYHDHALLAAYVPSAPPPQAEDRVALRTVDRFGGEASLSAVAPRRVPYDLGVRFERTGRRDRPGTDLPDEAPPDRTASLVQLQAALSPGVLAIDGTTSIHAIDGEALGASLTAYDAGAGVDLALGAARVTLGARVLGFQTSVANGDGQSFRVGPRVRAEAPLGASARLVARAEAHLEGASFADLLRENPYAEALPMVAPHVHPLDATLGLDLQAGAVQFALRGGFRSSSTLRYFERDPGFADAGASGLYRVRYGEATQLRAALDATLHAPAGVVVSAGGEFRSTRLSGEDRAVPFVAPLVGRLAVGVPFAGHRGLVQGTLYAEGARPAEAFAEDAPAWASFSIEGHYRFAGRFGLLVRGEQLAGRAERWPGFPQPPAVLTAGFRAGW